MASKTTAPFFWPAWTERAATTTLNIPRTKFLEKIVDDFMVSANAIRANERLSMTGKKLELAAFIGATLKQLQELDRYANSARVQLQHRRERFEEKLRGDAVAELRRQEVRRFLLENPGKRGALIENAINVGDLPTLSAVADSPAFMDLAHPDTIARARRRVFEVSDPNQFAEYEALDEATGLYEATRERATRFVESLAHATERQIDDVFASWKMADDRDAAVNDFLAGRDVAPKSEAQEAIDRYVETKERSRAEAEIALRERETALKESMTVTYDEEDALEAFLEEGEAA